MKFLGLHTFLCIKNLWNDSKKIDLSIVLHAKMMLYDAPPPPKKMMLYAIFIEIVPLIGLEPVTTFKKILSSAFLSYT